MAEWHHIVGANTTFDELREELQKAEDQEEDEVRLCFATDTRRTVAPFLLRSSTCLQARGSSQIVVFLVDANCWIEVRDVLWASLPEACWSRSARSEAHRGMTLSAIALCGCSEVSFILPLAVRALPCGQALQHCENTTCKQALACRGTITFLKRSRTLF
jgi:hypothetical protein